VTPPPVSPYGEDRSVEQPVIELFESLGWDHVDAYHEKLGSSGTLERETEREVILTHRVRAALTRLNPESPVEGIEQAVTELTRDRGVLQHARANAEFHALIRNRVPVTIGQSDGSAQPERITVIDWDNPQNNDFLLVSQLWVKSDLYRRRADLVGFVNGIPLVFIELKAAHKRLRKAYDENLRDYRDTIPHIFVPNGFIVLSNGAESRVGSVTAAWEHFLEWKKIDSEGEPGRVSIETVVRGMCAKERVLDIVENFTVFQDRPDGFVKLVARNHQYLGVNNAIARLDEVRHASPDERGRLGVFWHTQGSGKTVSMIYFAEKVLRKRAGNWTFVIVTDRDDLDDQAYHEFLWAAVTQKHTRATSSAHLRELLTTDGRYVFTLIHKFRTERGEMHPVLSERDDVIVITDEAHRTQYDTLALNMRNALPNAGFIGFTGTPLIAGEEKTRAVFGDYVSIYNYAASVADGATVPLYYENRIPALQLTNPTFSEELTALVEAADLDSEQERKLARLLGQQYELITRDDRLDTVAKDVVDHFLGRGFAGKAMVISIDKATALRTYDKVRRFWAERIAADEAKLGAAGMTDYEADLLRQEMAYMRATDMAVVISQAQNEVDDMAERGLDIKPHRKRMNEEDLEENFKNAEHPLRIAFVCAMWTTGFDVPSCSTIYLDKPMRNQTLMQTITRANRVFPGKNNGLIVGYVDVLGNLHRALAIYASSGALGPGRLPVEEKAALVDALRKAIDELQEFCLARDVDLVPITRLRKLEWVEKLKDVTDALMLSDDEMQSFIARASVVEKLFKAILPDTRANDFSEIRKVVRVILDRIAESRDVPDVSQLMGQVEQLLDDSVAANAYLIQGEEHEALMDLGQVDWDAVKSMFASGHQRTAAQKLRAMLTARITNLTRLNPTRVDLVERFQKLLDDYNAGSINAQLYFEELVALGQSLDEEEARAAKGGLTEEQQAIVDLITRPGPDLSQEEGALVKRVAKELLGVLKRDKIVLDWRKEQQTRAAVRVTVETTLDQLPDKFTRPLYAQKCDAVYQHVFDSYWDDGHSVYDRAA
jgi:type I restriction enzyme R subunit